MLGTITVVTFDDDFIMVYLTGKLVRFPCKANGIEWPPEQMLDISEPGAAAFLVVLERKSKITDEARAAMRPPNITARGALYRPYGDSWMIPLGDHRRHFAMSGTKP